MTNQQPIPLLEGTLVSAEEIRVTMTVFDRGIKTVAFAKDSPFAQAVRALAASAPDLARENAELRQRVKVLEAGLRSTIDAANSFCDEEGYEVAGQVKIRAETALAQTSELRQ